jgi:hypothetical protein
LVVGTFVPNTHVGENLSKTRCPDQRTSYSELPT